MSFILLYSELFKKLNLLFVCYKKDIYIEILAESRIFSVNILID